MIILDVISFFIVIYPEFTAHHQSLKYMKYPSNGFLVGSDIPYQAQVKSVKDDRVIFSVTNPHNEVFTGTYYLPARCRINPHLVFTSGAFWQVKVTKFTKKLREKEASSFIELNIEVDPLGLPVDEFVKQHPPGSIVVGKIVRVIKKGTLFLVALAENVYCVVRRSYNHAVGKIVCCKITKYDNEHKALLATLT